MGQAARSGGRRDTGWGAPGAVALSTGLLYTGEQAGEDTRHPAARRGNRAGRDESRKET